MTKYQPTQEQIQAVNMTKKNKNCKIIAYAGAGKTSTLQLIAQAKKEQGQRGIYIAFNKAIVQDAQSNNKFPANVQAKTGHSLAYNATDRRITAKLKSHHQLYVDNFAAWEGVGIDDMIITGDRSSYVPLPIHQHKENHKTEMLLDASKRFKIIKSAIEYYMRSTDDHPAQHHILSVLDDALGMKVDVQYCRPIAQQLEPTLIRLWDDFRNPEGLFRIPHDCYFKIWALSKPQINVDFILFDEAQDTDKLMLEVMQNQKAQVIFVGDPYQQIYEWRGAVDAMNTFDSDTTYLTQSFRFGAAIADLAESIIQPMRPHTDREKSLIGFGDDSVVDADNTMPALAQAILARTNAGVIDSAIEYYDEYPNRQIYLELSGNHNETKELIEAFHHLQTKSPKAQNHKIIKNFFDYNELRQYCHTFPSDDISAPFRLYEKHGLKRLLNVFDNFGDPIGADVIATTTHKAKGREWDHVLICEDFICYDKENRVRYPNPAEKRLLYVALTRAKKGLYIARIIPLLHEMGVLPTDDETATETATTTAESATKPTKRKYTPRNQKGEKARLQAQQKGYALALANGKVGRPSATDAHRVKILIDKGLTNQKIADKLGVSLSTVKRIKKKLI